MNRYSEDLEITFIDEIYTQITIMRPTLQTEYFDHTGSPNTNQTYTLYPTLLNQTNLQTSNQTMLSCINNTSMRLNTQNTYSNAFTPFYSNTFPNSLSTIDP